MNYIINLIYNDIDKFFTNNIDDEKLIDYIGKISNIGNREQTIKYINMCTLYNIDSFINENEISISELYKPINYTQVKICIKESIEGITF
jgi:hypothetical protein